MASALARALAPATVVRSASGVTGPLHLIAQTRGCCHLHRRRKVIGAPSLIRAGTLAPTVFVMLRCRCHLGVCLWVAIWPEAINYLPLLLLLADDEFVVP